MAGIGFELNKLFKKKGLFARLKAYGYAGIVCTGQMILGMILLLGIFVLSITVGIEQEMREQANSMITYTLLFSLMVTNIFSLVTTRFTADQIYEEKNSRILSSFFGSISIMLIFGELIYGIFLLFSGADFGAQVLCLMMFGELIVVWTEINYLTAIKDYRSIIIAFAVSVAVSLLTGYFLIKYGNNPQKEMLLIVCIAYGIMGIWYYILLTQYFPQKKDNKMYFLRWFDKYPELSPLGFFVGVGLFGHILIMWTSPIKRQVMGLFYEAPIYDIAALFAFLSILATTINFVTSVEVNFYPKYRNYYSLFIDGGSLADINQAEEEMFTTLVRELRYLVIKQMFVTVMFVVFGSYVLPRLPLGMGEDAIGIFRILSIGYAFYAIGNCFMLIQLYFSDNKGAFISGISFAIVSCIGTLFTANMGMKWYGVGFLIGTVTYTFVSIILLYRYLSDLKTNVLCSQPVVVEENKGVFTKISMRFDKKDENGNIESGE